MTRRRYKMQFTATTSIPTPVEMECKATVLTGIDLGFYIREIGHELLGSGTVIQKAVPQSKPLDIMSVERPRPDVLLHVQHVPPASLILTFADGTSNRWTFEQLHINREGLRLKTARRSEDQTAVVFDDNHGNPVRYDAGSMRYYVDQDYARKMDERLASLQFTQAELDELSTILVPPVGAIE